MAAKRTLRRFGFTQAVYALLVIFVYSVLSGITASIVCNPLYYSIMSNIPYT